MDKVALSSIIIELHVPNFETVKDFYGKLGFIAVWEIMPKEREGYLVMKMDKNILAFYCCNEEVYNHSYFKKFPKDTPRGYGTEIAIYLSSNGIEQYYSKVASKVDSICIV